MGGDVPKKIVIVTGASLGWAPRAPKEAVALIEAGFDVTVLGVSGVGRLADDLQQAARGGYIFESMDDAGGGFRAGREWFARIRNAFSRKIFVTAGIVTPWLFSSWATSLERRARQLAPKLTICHLEGGLWMGMRLLQSGLPVAVDMEDWYSEDLSPGARCPGFPKLLRSIEKSILVNSVYATSTTEVMAEVLAEEYKCKRPTRIYNVFPDPRLSATNILKDRSEHSRSMAGTTSRGREIPSIHWFSQTIGPGRGLEGLFLAAETIGEPFEIHLRGMLGRYESWLETQVRPGLRDKVFIHDVVSCRELPLRIAEHDIGFAGEMRSPRNKNLTASNKIFQYLQGGLAVLASDTDGQKEVAALACGAVRLFGADDVENLKLQLVELLSDRSHLRVMRERAFEAAKNLCWEKEGCRLVELVTRLVR